MKTSKDYKKMWDDYHEALNKEGLRKYPHIPLPEWVTPQLTDQFNSPYRKDAFKLNFGDYFLFQIEFWNSKKAMVTHPRLGMFIEYLPADQTVEFRWIEKIRNWEHRFKIDDEDNDILFPETEIKSHIDWMQIIYVFEVWKERPNWKQIRKAMNKTFYYGNLPRINKIKDILE